jgi:hypothetical protein
MEKDYLMLKRAALSRPSGEWNDDDYDVLANAEVVGGIFKANAAPVGSPWMWTFIFLTMRAALQRTTTPQRARLRWQHSLRAGGGNSGPAAGVKWWAGDLTHAPC